MFKCSFCFLIFVSLSCFVRHIMPESIANLRSENKDLKSKVSTLTEEISRLKDLFEQQSNSAAPSATEKSHSLEFLSKEYDDFLFFKTIANKELQRLSSHNSQRLRPGWTPLPTPSMNFKNITFNTMLKLSVFPRCVLTKRFQQQVSFV